MARLILKRDQMSDLCPLKRYRSYVWGELRGLLETWQMLKKKTFISVRELCDIQIVCPSADSTVSSIYNRLLLISYQRIHVFLLKVEVSSYPKGQKMWLILNQAENINQIRRYKHCMIPYISRSMLSISYQRWKKKICELLLEMKEVPISYWTS